MPRRVQDLRDKVRVARRDLLDRPGHEGEPGVEEIADRTGLTPDEVRDGLEALQSHSALPLDAMHVSRLIHRGCATVRAYVARPSRHQQAA